MEFRIEDRLIGDGHPTFIIAELSANHMNDYDIAVKTIEAMAKSGADAVKFQTYTPDTITLDCDNEYFQIKQGTIWDGQVLYNLYEDAFMPWDWQPKLKKVAEDLGLIVFSSPFDETSVDFLEDMDADNDKIAVLKCTSSYPAPLEEINLKTIPDLKENFKTVVGLSDHTLGSDVAVASVAMGAKIIEKHFILDRTMEGPDSDFSMEPDEFKQMVDSIRNVEKALGKVSYELSDKMTLKKENS